MAQRLFTDNPAPLLRTLYEVYTDRNAELWKRKDVAAWLRSGVRMAIRMTVDDPARAAESQATRSTLHQLPCLQRYAGASSDAVLGRVVRLPEDEGPADVDPGARHPMRRYVWAPRNPLLLFLATLLPWNTLESILHLPLHNPDP
eukprot:TRINITY_DN9934_c0_g1_i1.p1 TRINITY_DN9934_c0_g1~~TRINITY_DN9934_c0_g1_i1.p1  ORF type:complete len:159 (-),score=33.95 TRINITY_DN9934_c0_g1_i1:92-526(-)